MDIDFSRVSGAAQPMHPEPARTGLPAEHRDLIQAVRTVNAADLMGQDNELSFLMDRETRRPVVRVVDRRTHEVIQQVPPEHVLRLARDWRARQREQPAAGAPG